VYIHKADKDRRGTETRGNSFLFLFLLLFLQRREPYGCRWYTIRGSEAFAMVNKNPRNNPKREESNAGSLVEEQQPPSSPGNWNPSKQIIRCHHHHHPPAQLAYLYI
jgi:hypothetical protein